MMKKKLIPLLLTVFLAMFLCVPAFAESELGYVTDAAELLTEEEYHELTNQATEISNNYDCGVYVITVEDFTEYVDTLDIVEAAQAIYRDYKLGVGEEKNGLLLLLSMAERDYVLYAYGYGNTAFTDYGKDYLAEFFLDNLGEDDWYGGFKDYITVSGELLQSARNGSPVDVDNKPELPYARVYGVMVCILLGFLIAFIVKAVLLGQLKSVEKGTEAEAFVTAEGLRLTEQYDQYTHTTQSRVYDPPKESTSSSGGTTTDSSGGSSKSGKF